MKIITLKKEECPYCNVSLKILGDEDRGVFKWHLAGHNIAQQFYGTNEKIEKLIADYAHDFRSERYDEETMITMFRKFYKECIEPTPSLNN